MKMISCASCGKRYDPAVEELCPRCGAFNQPARTAAASASIAPASGTRDAGTGRGKQQLQRDLEANLKQMEQAMTKFLGERPRGPRLPGGHL